MNTNIKMEITNLDSTDQGQYTDNHSTVNTINRQPIY